MSGGHFEYKDVFLQDISDELKQVILDNNSDNLDDDRYNFSYSDEVIIELNKISEQAETLGQLLHHADWLLSGDDSEETFLNHVNKSTRK